MKGFGFFFWDITERDKNVLECGRETERQGQVWDNYFFPDFFSCVPWLGRDLSLIGPNGLFSVFCLKLLSLHNSRLTLPKTMVFFQNALPTPAWDFLMQRHSFELNIYNGFYFLGFVQWIFQAKYTERSCSLLLQGISQLNYVTKKHFLSLNIYCHRCICYLYLIPASSCLGR